MSAFFIIEKEGKIKMKNKRTLYAMIGILFLTIFFGITKVKAEQYTGEAIWPSEKIADVYIKKYREDGYINYHQANFIRRSEDNKFVYCLQPFVDIDNNLPYYNIARSDFAVVLNMTEKQWQRISLLAYYGYQYKDNSYDHSAQKWYIIAQVMIWRTADPTSRIVFTDTLNGKDLPNKFASEIAEMESILAKHYTKPEFNLDDVKLPIGKSIDITDSNSVLSDFKVSSVENGTASINGNTLTITSNSIENVKVKLVKKLSYWTTPPVVYYSNHSQNVMRVGNADPIPMNIELESVGGKVEIYKVDSETKNNIPQGNATLGGAKLSFNIGPVSLQPSEFVKILFVFFVAASLNKSTEFKNVVVTTAIAAAHVLILVLSTDLGAALIYFIVYLIMLYVATRQPLYAIAGVAAGCGAAVVGYHLFSHIKVRVAAWQDPFAAYSEGGYQIAQSLFAIGSGGWFGTGLFRGQPDTIPVAETDLIFSAMTEEMGLIFTLCLILVCVSCYVMFLNIAMELRNFFYKLVALGLGTCYIFQVFLQIGGVTKFIPLTGVTLPFVSYGGSSLLSTMIMFGIIQGLYIVREDEEAEEEHQIEMQRARQRNRSRQNERRRQSSSNAKSGRSRQDGRDRRREYDGDNRDRARQRERDLRNESGRTTGKKTTKSRPRFEDVPEQRQQRQRRTRPEQRIR